MWHNFFHSNVESHFIMHAYAYFIKIMYETLKTSLFIENVVQNLRSRFRKNGVDKKTIPKYIDDLCILRELYGFGGK